MGKSFRDEGAKSFSHKGYKECCAQLDRQCRPDARRDALNNLNFIERFERLERTQAEDTPLW